MHKFHDHSLELEKIIEKIPSYDEAKKLADTLQVLSDPTRIRILWILCHTNECVTDIGIAIGMSAPAVSHHLKLLKQLNLIKNNKVGKEMQYTIADTPEAKLIHKYIEDMLQISCPKKKE